MCSVNYIELIMMHFFKSFQIKFFLDFKAAFLMGDVHRNTACAWAVLKFVFVVIVYIHEWFMNEYWQILADSVIFIFFIVGTISRNSDNKQVLDKLQVERERGITVKAQTASLFYNYKGETYLLNLIDTPVSVGQTQSSF